ncbi:MAG TPA: protein-L-isoaspartate(D-aspartate) O-methyltransferase [Bacteroidales bacterium]|nr:protein-L-isoaspartate(D-aspartate) O-methyltransferase [Bacteroidales bacterium]
MPANQITDSYRHQGMRRKLVESLRQKGIVDETVLAALNHVPRHFFFDSSFLEFAYEDKAFPIGSGQTISQPYTVAFQTQLLNPGRGMKILEIGTGSGYQACILAVMGLKVYTIERQKLLFDKTKALLKELNYRVNTYFGDGYLGLKAHAPFDRILITAAAPGIPEALINQLKPGGIMVIPVGAGDIQVMKRIIKISDNETTSETHGTFRFVPMLGEKARDI